MENTMYAPCVVAPSRASVTWSSISAMCMDHRALNVLRVVNDSHGRLLSSSMLWDSMGDRSCVGGWNILIPHERLLRLLNSLYWIMGGTGHVQEFELSSSSWASCVTVNQSVLDQFSIKALILGSNHYILSETYDLPCIKGYIIVYCLWVIRREICVKAIGTGRTNLWLK